jgi:hypothetical protein
MATPRETIDHSTLSKLIEAGSIRSAEVVGQPGGWSVVVNYGMTQRALAARRGEVRLFRRFETLAEYLKGIGYVKLTVNTADFDKTAPKPRTRPDAAQQLRRAHQAAAYDTWFREQVGQAIQEADDPSTPWVSGAEVSAKSAARRAAWRAKAAGK